MRIFRAQPYRRHAKFLAAIVVASLSAASLSLITPSHAGATVTAQPTIIKLPAVTSNTINAIQAYVTARPSAFGGIWINPRDHVVHVTTVDANSDTIIGAVRAAEGPAATSNSSAGSNWSLVLTPARFSSATLSEIMTAVPGTAPFSTAAKGYLAGWYIDAQRDQVAIGLTHITPALQRAAQIAFGGRVYLTTMTPVSPQVLRILVRHQPRLVLVHKSSRTASTVTCPLKSSTRLLDCYSEYNGGDRIVRYVTIKNGYIVYQCTDSWYWGELPKGSPAGITTAGHCGPTGTSWFQGYYESSNHTINYTGTMGKDKLTSWKNNRADGEFLTGSDHPLEPAVYTVKSKLKSYVNYGQPIQGEDICADGSFTTQSCGGVVRSTNGCYNIRDGSTTVHVCDLAYATSKSRLAQPGDSGGPVYHYETSGNLDALGLISASNSKGTELFFSNMNGLESALKGHPFVH